METTNKKPNYDKDYMVKVIDKYVEDTDIPILKEVCYQNHWPYDTIMKQQRNSEILWQSIKRLLDKKESQLERLGLMGKIDRTMAVFSLKQLGWRDKKEMEVSTEKGNDLKIVFVDGKKE